MNAKYTFEPNLIVEVTNVCNMSCKGCYAPNVIKGSVNEFRDSKHLTLREIESVWPEDQNFEKVAIRGGEPSLNPDIVKIIAFLQERVEYLYLETNGKWLESDSDLLLAVKQSGTILKLSFDKMHGIKLSQKNDLIKNFVKKGFKIAIAITSNSYNDFIEESSHLEPEVLSKVELFWQRKAQYTTELVKSKFGVISTYGVLKDTVTNKLKLSDTEILSLFVLFYLVFIPSSRIYGSPRSIAIGLASNFSDISSSSSNPFGNYFHDGIQLAIRDNKHTLKKNGIALRTLNFDYGTNQTKIVSVVNDAIKSDIIAMVGYNYSSHALIAAPLHFKGKLPMISPSATANRLSSFKRYVHTTCFNNRFMGINLAQLAKKNLGVNKIAIVVAKDCAYCEDLSEAFAMEFNRIGGNVKIFGILDSDTNFQPVINEIKNDSLFDAVLVPNHELTSAKIISSLVTAGIKLPYIGGDGWGDVGKEFLRVIDKSHFEGFTATHWHQDDLSKVSKEFIKKYKLVFHKDPNDTAVLAYDSMSYLIKVILEKKAYTREDLENALNKKRRYIGVSGTSNFVDGKAPIKSMVVLKVTEKKFQFFKRVEPAL